MLPQHAYCKHEADMPLLESRPAANDLRLDLPQISDYVNPVHTTYATGAPGTLIDDALASGAVKTAEVFGGVSNSNPNLRPATNALEDGMEDRGLPQSSPYISHPFAPKLSSPLHFRQSIPEKQP